MFELLTLIATFGAAGLGYVQTRAFVRKRLAYVDAVQRPATPWIAAGLAALVAAPVAWILPLVGTGTAITFGAAVGLGTAAGARDARKRLPAG